MIINNLKIKVIKKLKIIQITQIIANKTNAHLVLGAFVLLYVSTST